jgi:hypothetical protein
LTCLCKRPQIQMAVFCGVGGGDGRNLVGRIPGVRNRSCSSRGQKALATCHRFQHCQSQATDKGLPGKPC